MATDQNIPELKKNLNELLSELHVILSENKNQLEQAEIRDDLLKLLAWAESAYAGSARAEKLLEGKGPGLVDQMRDWIELVGREYMDMEDESPTTAPAGEPDPQKLYETAGKLEEVIETLSHLKEQAERSQK
ncbi:hypothetical protein [Emcibacter sp.]|uniref:hypothetical protein n=1 Tax=Emcibacter sp. TaxID=1979954 RepID=UPI002AA6EE43|nr:hypothetical protein [Emcibacter sp.]